MKNELLDIVKCLNEKNKSFYIDEIKSHYNLNLLSSGVDNNVWCIRYSDITNEVFIYAGNDFPNPGSFTHEILHLYLFKKGFGNWGLTSLCFYNRLNQNLYNQRETINGLMNAIAHQKMLPIFISQLKFDISDFFSCWEPFVTENRVSEIENRYNSKSANSSLNFTDFIRIFFDSRYHFNDKRINEYQGYLNRLKMLDSKLFNILQNICNDWNESKENYDNTTFFNSLYGNLEKYLTE